jgi:hypothetical protein
MSKRSSGNVGDVAAERTKLPPPRRRRRSSRRRRARAANDDDGIPSDIAAAILGQVYDPPESFVISASAPWLRISASSAP